MKCERTCMFCDGSKTYLFNYSEFHGVCFQHCNLEGEFYQCSYCESVVPVVTRSCGSCSAQVSLVLNKGRRVELPFALSVDDSYVNNLKISPCGEYQCVNCISNHIQICRNCNQSFECEICKQPKTIHQAIECEHIICTDCYGYYKLCTICEANKPKLICQVCLSDESVELMSTCNTHTICSSCYQKSENNCTICIGTFPCPDCNNLKYFRSQLECGHIICHECFSNHKCFKCQVCESTSDVYQMPSCKTHHICQVCYSKSNSQCTLCIGKYKCESCLTSKYFTFKLPCNHDICYDCSFHHNCAPQQICNICGSNQGVELSNSCKNHYFCNNCHINAESICDICVKTFKCIQCEKKKQYKSNCNHNFCIDCSQQSKCQICQKENQDATLIKQHSNDLRKDTNLSIQANNYQPDPNAEAKTVDLNKEKKLNPINQHQPSQISPNSNHPKLIKNIEIYEQVNTSSDEEVPLNNKNDAKAIPHPPSPNKENLHNPSYIIEINDEKARLNPTNKNKNKKKSQLQCSCRFILLIIFYLMSLFYLCGCFFNCCRGFSTHLPSPKWLFCLCGDKSQAKKEWKHLLTFAWLSSNKHN